MTKVLIVNSVMVNNGDAALVTALASMLSNTEFHVTIATHNFHFSVTNYKSFEFCRDVVGSALLGPRKVCAYFMIPVLMLTKRAYRVADLVIGAPGGYVNSYYGVKWKLYVFKWAKRFGKKTVLYAQSIGPLSAKDRSVLKSYSKYIDVIVARDQLSYSTAVAAGVAESRLILAEDAIFLQAPLEIPAPKASTMRACISVREWTYDGRSSARYSEMIRDFANLLLSKGYWVDFLSTCQGVPGYIDDARMATEIAKSLDASSRSRVTVVSRYFNSFDLQKELKKYDLVVGTRLHMCLLSILNGVPAFNISYEAKGRECYRYLRAEGWSVDYNSEVSDAVRKLDQFISGLDAAKGHFLEVARERHQSSVGIFRKSLSLVAE